MITLRLPRHYIEVVILKFFPYINLYKQTRLNNVAHKSLVSQEYLIAVVINNVLEEIEALFQKKLFNSRSEKVKMEFSDAQGVLLYRTLLALPVDSSEIFQVMVLSKLIEDLDAELIRQQIYQRNKPRLAEPPPKSFSDYFDI